MQGVDTKTAVPLYIVFQVVGLFPLRRSCCDLLLRPHTLKGTVLDKVIDLRASAEVLLMRYNSRKAPISKTSRIIWDSEYGGLFWV